MKPAQADFPAKNPKHPLKTPPQNPATQQKGKKKGQHMRDMLPFDTLISLFQLIK